MMQDAEGAVGREDDERIYKSSVRGCFVACQTKSFKCPCYAIHHYTIECEKAALFSPMT